MISKLLCAIGLHKWYPVKGALIKYEYRSKYDIREHAEGECARCKKRVHDISRDYFW
jgi:hypothetical protein